jgi:hypothetical protein
LTALITPEFFRILPWMARLYPKFAAVPLRYILFDAQGLFVVIGIGAAWFARKNPELKRFVDLLALAMLAMYVSVLLQGKNWGYHWYPVIGLSLLLCAAAIDSFVRPVRGLVVAGLAAVSIVVMSMHIDRIATRLVKQPHYLADMLPAAEPYRGGTVLALSHSLGVAFPLVNMLQMRFPSPYGHLWMLPAIYADPSEAQRSPPDLIIMQQNMMPYFMNDARFAQLLRESRPIKSVGFFTLFDHSRR